MKNPWYKTSFQYSPLGTNLKVIVPHDVFSTQRIDEGTLLLLEHLPASNPALILDMGCGYGALGLPIAAKYPNATIEMVDRDLLAVKWSEENAVANGLSNVQAYGSLGFRDVRSTGQAYDWILCNVPARIGNPFIENLIEQGRSQLTAGGELRVVVIRDLGPVLEEMKAKNHWPLTEVARGPRHTIYAIASESGAVPPSEPDALYFRDQVQVGELILDRPFDIGGDDQKRLRSGLPVLLDTLPRQDPGQKILCFRSGYGALPLTARQKWPQAQVVAIDRDLLGTTFTRQNALRLDLGGGQLDVREAAHFVDAIQPGETFQLILGELSPSADQWVAQAEMTALETLLAKGGEALILCLDKIEKDWVKAYAAKSPLSVHKVLTREGYTVVRFSKA